MKNNGKKIQKNRVRFIIRLEDKDGNVLYPKKFVNRRFSGKIELRSDMYDAHMWNRKADAVLHYKNNEKFYKKYSVTIVPVEINLLTMYNSTDWMFLKGLPDKPILNYGPKIQCVHCLDVIRSHYRTDVAVCSCGKVSITGGNEFTKIEGSYVLDWIWAQDKKETPRKGE